MPKISTRVKGKCVIYHLGDPRVIKEEVKVDDVGIDVQIE